MGVFCGKCGEELLGAVNRCWRCGQVFGAVPDEGGLPPVRRPTTSGDTEAPPIVHAQVVPTRGTDAQAQPVRATRYAPKQPSVGASVPSRRKDAAAVTATTLGLISLPSSLFTFWTAIPAIIGFALGLIGLRSAHRRSALVGLLLCCIALSFCMIRSVVLWQAHYESQRRQQLYGDEF